MTMITRADGSTYNSVLPVSIPDINERRARRENTPVYDVNTTPGTPYPVTDDMRDVLVPGLENLGLPVVFAPALNMVMMTFRFTLALSDDDVRTSVSTFVLTPTKFEGYYDLHSYDGVLSEYEDTHHNVSTAYVLHEFAKFAGKSDLWEPIDLQNA